MAIYRGTGGSTSTTEQATIDAVNEDAATATTKAAEASASATAAATSATSASSSATSAASSASTATTKATEASTSATNAATSASAASTSASAASTSASNAASSATTATTQAASATTSAANAAASETAAETAESNAEDFASDAQKSAYGAVDTLQTLSDSSTLYSARHYAAKTAVDAATATTKAAEAATSASTASAASDAALAALDSFDDRYLGSKTSDPTTDNDGDALVAGALYYNSTDDVMKVYEGSAWVAAYASVSGALLAINNLDDLNNAATARTNLGVAIGTDVQAYSSVLAGTTASYTTAEETKLAGIETAATADQTAQEIATAIDADATAEATLKSALGLGTAAYTASTDYATAAQGALADSALQANQTITLSGDVSGSGTTAITVTVADDSHNHVISNVDGLQTALDGKQATGDYVVATGDSMTGNLTFGDNDKAIFGAGSDLQIYYDGTNSVIKENGSGSLVIQGQQYIVLEDVDGNNYIRCQDSGDVVLYYNGSTKLATTSTGIDVTGTVTADGLTLDAGANFNFNETGAADILWGTSTYSYITGNAGAGTLTAGTNSTERFRIASTGDISFYEDTGTTAKFFWDASNEALAVGGTSTFTSKITASAANGTAYTSNSQLRVSGGGVNNNRASIVFSDDALSDGKISYYPHALEASRSLSLSARTTESDFVITGSGNVGIGTSSPSTTLDVNGTAKVTRAIGTVTAENDMSFDLSASNQFTCTPTANGSLTFTNVTAGQSGTILFVNSGGYTITAASASCKIMGDTMLDTISTAGTYLIGYYTDGTYAYVSNTGAMQ